MRFDLFCAKLMPNSNFNRQSLLSLTLNSRRLVCVPFLFLLPISRILKAIVIMRFQRFVLQYTRNYSNLFVLSFLFLNSVLSDRSSAELLMRSRDCLFALVFFKKRERIQDLSHLLRMLRNFLPLLSFMNPTYDKILYSFFHYLFCDKLMPLALHLFRFFFFLFTD